MGFTPIALDWFYNDRHNILFSALYLIYLKREQINHKHETVFSRHAPVANYVPILLLFMQWDLLLVLLWQITWGKIITKFIDLTVTAWSSESVVLFLCNINAWLLSLMMVTSHENLFRITTVGELRSTQYTKTPLYVRSGSYIKQILMEHLSYIKQISLEHLSFIKETSWNTSGRT